MRASPTSSLKTTAKVIISTQAVQGFDGKGSLTTPGCVDDFDLDRMSK